MSKYGKKSDKSKSKKQKKDGYGWTKDDYMDNGHLPKNHPLNPGYSGPD